MLPFDPLTLKNTEKYGLSKSHFQNFPTFNFSHPQPPKTPKNLACLNPTFDFLHPRPPKTPKNLACLNPTFNFLTLFNDFQLFDPWRPNVTETLKHTNSFPPAIAEIVKHESRAFLPVFLHRRFIFPYFSYFQT